jgi:hypothetical protein
MNKEWTAVAIQKKFLERINEAREEDSFPSKASFVHYCVLKELKKRERKV